VKPNGSRSRFPEARRLTTGLRAVFQGTGASPGSIAILHREPNEYESTFPTEIVTCRLGNNDTTLRLFIKYGTETFDGVFGHRGDVSYEARVYREVLQPLGMSTPRFYGVYRDPRTRVSWLVLDYLNGGRPTSHLHDPNAMVQAARWIGRFHAANERRLPDPRLKFLKRYNEAYYMGWAWRTKKLFAPTHARFPWLAPLCDGFGPFVHSLLAATRTVIHGEYFGLNVVYQNGTSWPADWQSAAIAPGEIDLASLTHSWPTPLVKRCEREYRRSRWPDGAPTNFEETLDAARFYMNFRWMGDPVLMTLLLGSMARPKIPKKVKKFIKELRAVGERAGLVA